MATAPVMLSLEEYLRSSYEPDADFVNGGLEVRPVGEYEHSRLQWLIAVAVGLHEKEWHIRGVTEQRIRVSSERVRVCDLALLRADAPRESVTRTPPLVCIEILSPEDRLSRAKLVLQDYLGMGVPNVWLVDPIRRSAHIFSSEGLTEVDPAMLEVAGTQIRLDFSEIFRGLD